MKFTGQVESYADPDDEDRDVTVKIGGRDVLAVLDATFPSQPIRIPTWLSVWLEDDHFEGEMRLSRGWYGDDPAELQVGSRDLLAELNRIGDATDRHNWRLGPMFARPARPVTMFIAARSVPSALMRVTLAQHWQGHLPHDSVTVPRARVKSMQRDGYVLAGTTPQPIGETS